MFQSNQSLNTAPINSTSTINDSLPQLCRAVLAGAICDSDFVDQYGRAAYNICKLHASVDHSAQDDDGDLYAPFDAARLAVYGVVLHIVCILGALGNGATLVVLHQREFGRSSSTVYLKVMIAFDTLYLVANYFHNVLINGLHIAPWGVSPLPTYSRLYVAYILSDFFRNVGVLLTVAATVERYIFIRHSMHASKLCTARRARVTSAVLVVVAACYELPRVLAARVRLVPDGVGSCDARTMVYLIEDDYSFVSKELDYAVEYFGMVAFMFLPVGGLVVMTAILLDAISKSNMLRRSLSNSTPSKNLEININAVLLSVVITYILCSIPMLLISIIRLDKSREWEPFFGSTLTGATLYKLALTVLNVNAAINVLLFCVFGKKFRRQFRKIFLSFGASVHQPASGALKSTTISASLRRAAMAAAQGGGDSPETSQTLLSGWIKSSTKGANGFRTPTRGSPATQSRSSSRFQ